MLAADNWCVKVSDKVYGPYTSQQLRKFAHEGRLAGWSLIAPAGSRDWREARAEGTLAQFFGGKSAGTAGPKSFGKREDDGTQKTQSTKRAESLIRESADSNTARRPQPLGDRKNSTNDQPIVGPSNFVIVFDVVSGAASRVEAAMLSLGPAYRLADNVWSVNCQLTAIGVRNAIAPYLRPRESIFVVDATNGRTSWQNYAPQAHAKITEIFSPSKLSA